MEQNKESRNKVTYVCNGQLIYNKQSKIYNGERIDSSINDDGKTGPLPYTIHKNRLKMD